MSNFMEIYSEPIALVFYVFGENVVDKQSNCLFTLGFPFYSIYSVINYVKFLSSKKSFKRRYKNAHLYVSAIYDIGTTSKTIYSCIYVDGHEFGFDGDIKQVELIQDKLLEL